MNPLSRAQIAKVVEILFHARTDPQVKLRFGARKRERLSAALKAGGKINTDDYRYKWLKDTRSMLLAVLEKQAVALNTQAPWDQASVGDLVDCAQAVIYLLKAKMDEPEEK